MPSSGFFRKLGLFARDAFFNLATCSHLQSEMCLSESENALVVRGEGDGDVLDEAVRKVLSIKADAPTTDMVWEAIRTLRPTLEDHFHVHLRQIEQPVFLRYGSGAFYRPHMDGHPEAPSSTRDRLVSVVIFLNGGSLQPSP